MRRVLGILRSWERAGFLTATSSLDPLHVQISHATIVAKSAALKSIEVCD
jgi:hypothetical protein